MLLLRARGLDDVAARLNMHYEAWTNEQRWGEIGAN